MKVHVNNADLVLGGAKEMTGKVFILGNGISDLSPSSVGLLSPPPPPQPPLSFILSQSELTFENSVLAFGCSLSVQ